MTKIVAMSDLHWEGRAIMPEQAEKRLGEGDILILAGDICTVKSLENGLKYLDTFLEIANERFKHVVAIAGNHEAYRYDYFDALRYLKNWYADNDTIFLDNEAVELEGLSLYGGTLWTDFAYADEKTRSAILRGMNDFYLIEVATNAPPEIGVWDDQWALSQHIKFLEGLKGLRPDIVISHHAPSHGSVHPKYVGQLLNRGYYSDLEDTIAVENPSLWVHGHMHDAHDYKVHDTRVYCNPRGYRGERVELKWDEVINVEARRRQTGTL